MPSEKRFKIQPRTKKKIHSHIHGLNSSHSNFSKLLKNYDQRNSELKKEVETELSKSSKIEISANKKQKIKLKRKRRKRVKSLRKDKKVSEKPRRVNSVKKYDSEKISFRKTGEKIKFRKDSEFKNSQKIEELSRNLRNLDLEVEKPRIGRKKKMVTKNYKKERDRVLEKKNNSRSTSRKSSRSSSLNFKNKEILRKRLKERALINQNNCKLNLKDMIVHDRILSSIIGNSIV